LQHVTQNQTQARAIDGAAERQADRAREVREIARWLSLGSLIPLVGWLHGVGLLWCDPVLTRGNKVIGTLAFPGGWFGASVAAWLITRESSGYCYTSSFGEVSGPELATDSGCVQTGVLSPAVGIALLVLVVVAAAAGPVWVRRQGLRRRD
jgi:hypothetical protein